MKVRLNGLLADLQTAYVQYNKVSAQIPIVEAQINGNDQEIQILIKNSDAERNRIANDKLKLADIIAQINSIQTRLNELQNKQITIQTAITKEKTISLSMIKLLLILMPESRIFKPKSEL